MAWKSKLIAKTDERTSTVKSISSKNKKGFVDVTFDNHDVAQISDKSFTYKAGDSVTYQIEVYRWEEGISFFETSNLIVVKTDTKPISALSGVDKRRILFLDIEAVRIQKELLVDTDLFQPWRYKKRNAKESTEVIDLIKSFDTDAGLYAEFSKIVCVSIGIIRDGKLITQSYFGHNELDFLPSLGKDLDAFHKKGYIIAGHMVKGYDLPFLMRRYLINRLTVPKSIDFSGKKPWEIDIIDTAELWKGTGIYSASLINIAVAFGLPSPKQSIDGSEVSDTYYNEEAGLEKIVKYCEGDVLTTANITMPMLGEGFIDKVESKTFEDGNKE